MQLSEEEADSNQSAPGESSGGRGDTSGRGEGPALEDAVLQNSHHFHQWHSELEAARTSETEEKYRRYASTLEGHMRGCQQILSKARTAGWLPHPTPPHHGASSAPNTLSGSRLLYHRIAPR